MELPSLRLQPCRFLTAIVFAVVCTLSPVFSTSSGYLSAQVTRDEAPANPVADSPADLENSRIAEVRIEGLDRLGAAEVLTRMKLRTGSKYTAAALDEEYRRLWSSGDFVSINPPTLQKVPEGVIITITLEERQPIRSVIFEGNDAISDKVLLREIQTQEEELYDPLIIREDRDVIRGLLLKDGYPFSKVGSRLVGDLKNLSVVFEIEEGPQVLIQSVGFVGAGSIASEEILKIMQLNPRTFLGIGQSGKFDPRLLETDLNQIREYYFLNGYFDAQVSLGRQEYTEGLQHMQLVISVDEGPRYRVGSVEFEFTGEHTLSSDDLRSVCSVTAGSEWDGTKIKEDAEAIRKLFNDQAFIDASVDPTVIYPLEGEDVTLKYLVSQGSKAKVGEIQIRGNRSTKDEVIRRQLEVYPGEEFSPSQIQDSLSNLYRLQYFNGIRPYFDTSDAAGDRPVVFELAEGSTGRALFGVGYSTSTGILGNIAIEKRNFDITDWPTSLTDIPGSFTGAGQKLVLEAQPGSEYSRYRLQFFEPYLAGSHNSLRVSAFRSVLLRQNYTEDRNSAGITLGRLFDRELKIRGEVGIRREKVTIENIVAGAPAVIVDSEGKTPLTALDLRFDWDQRVFRPDVGAVDGWNAESTFTRMGGALGGDLDLNKVELSFGLFQTIYEKTDNLRHVLAFKNNFGIVESYGDSSFIPIFERYYLGGPRSLRGFDYRGAGPSENGIETGGAVRHFGTLEYSWPLVDSNIRGTLFADFGNLADDADAFSLDDYRLGVGGGIILYIPLFGQNLPVSVTWTEAVLKEPGDRLREFSFDLGYILR
jgi:outer membrane protein insertion porin family